METDKEDDKQSDRSFIEIMNEFVEQKMRLCNGCTSLISEIILSEPLTDCGLPPIYNEYTSCPCLDCLVKSACTKLCDEHQGYSNIIKRSHKRIVRRLTDNELARMYEEKHGNPPSKDKEDDNPSWPGLGTPTCMLKMEGD